MLLTAQTTTYRFKQLGVGQVLTGDRQPKRKKTYTIYSHTNPTPILLRNQHDSREVFSNLLWS